MMTLRFSRRSEMAMAAYQRWTSAETDKRPHAKRSNVDSEVVQFFSHVVGRCASYLTSINTKQLAVSGCNRFSSPTLRFAQHTSVRFHCYLLCVHASHMGSRCVGVSQTGFN